METRARSRSALTLLVLLLIFVGGVVWAWSSVTEPFPGSEPKQACTQVAIAKGERVRPSDVLVNVLNASDTDGLAADTMDSLIGKGFGEGGRGNATADTGDHNALVWVADKKDPSARLVRTYLGDNAVIVQQATSEPGITVVVGDGFPGVDAGRKFVKASADGYVCRPPAAGDS